MLDAYIIEQIRKRDEERHRVYERPALKLPIEPPRSKPRREPNPEADPSRVIIIDI